MENWPFFRFLPQLVPAQAEVPQGRRDRQATGTAGHPAHECLLPLGRTLPSRFQNPPQGGAELEDLLQLQDFPGRAPQDPQQLDRNAAALPEVQRGEVHLQLPISRIDFPMQIGQQLEEVACPYVVCLK